MVPVSFHPSSKMRRVFYLHENYFSYHVDILLMKITFIIIQ